MKKIIRKIMRINFNMKIVLKNKFLLKLKKKFKSLHLIKTMGFIYKKDLLLMSV